MISLVSKGNGGYALDAPSKEIEKVREIGNWWTFCGVIFKSQAKPQWMTGANVLYMWGHATHRDKDILSMSDSDAELIRKALVYLNKELGFLYFEPEEWEE